MASANNSETDFPVHLAAYIDARRVLLGLPTADVLPCRHPRTESDESKVLVAYPCIYITAADWESPHPRRLAGAVIVELQTQAESTTVITEDTWLVALHRLLSDVGAFREWLAARTGDDAPGWALRVMRLKKISTAIDPEKMLRARRTDLFVHVRAHELAGMPAAV